MGLRRISMIVAAVAGLGTALANAQTRPTTPDDLARPEVASPYWGGGMGAPRYESAAVPGEQLMTQTVLAVPQARADAVVAKWTFRRLDRQLNISSDGMRRDFRQSDEYAAAVNEFNNAYADLETARARAARTLIDSPEYQAALSLRKGVSDQIADEHELKEPDRTRLVALASLKLDYISPLRSLETDRFSTDPAVRDAKAKLLSAARKIAAMERDFARDVRDSIELADIRKGREDARIAMLASSAFLEEMRLARTIALEFAYVGQGVDPWNRRYDRGYGYSYGGYYSGGYYNGGFFGRSRVVGIGEFNGPVGVTGNTPFGRGANAIIGPGPSKANQGGNNNTNPGGVFGSGGIPSPFGK